MRGGGDMFKRDRRGDDGTCVCVGGLTNNKKVRVAGGNFGGPLKKSPVKPPLTNVPFLFPIPVVLQQVDDAKAGRSGDKESCCIDQTTHRVFPWCLLAKMTTE